MLLLGAGEMGELAAKHLMEHGTLPVYVANRTEERGADLARALAGVAVPFDAVPRVLEAVDIVIACTAAPEPVVRVAEVAAALAARTRPLFFIDLGVPRNVEVAVNDLDNAFCYDIDDLRAVVDANLRERQYQAQRAETLIEREVSRFLARLRDLEVVPTIVSLRDKLEAIRRAEVDKALARLPGASDETRRVVEALSQAIVSKVLHAPIVKLRDSSRDGRGRRWRTLIAEVFGLREANGRPARTGGGEGPDRHAGQPSRARAGGGDGGGARRPRGRGRDRHHPHVGRPAGPGGAGRFRRQGPLRERDRGGAARRPGGPRRPQPQGRAGQAAGRAVPRGLPAAGRPGRRPGRPGSRGPCRPRARGGGGDLELASPRAAAGRAPRPSRRAHPRQRGHPAQQARGAASTMRW